MKGVEDFTSEQMAFVESLFKRGVEEGMAHSSPSPLTLEKFEKMDHIMQDIQESMKRLLQHSEERDKKVDEMYKVFSNGNFLISVAKWWFGLLITLGGAYLLFDNIMHR